MIRFRCHRCKRPIAAPDGHVGKRVKCPGCMIVTIVPDIPGAQAAREKAAKPARPAPPPVPQGPPDPLDELAAAVDGDVQTATFDDEYTAYEQVETYDGSQEFDPFAQDASLPASRSRRRKFRPARSMEAVDILLCVLVPVIAIIYGALREDKQVGQKMIKLSVVLIVISTVLSVVVGVLMALVGASRSGGL